MTTAQQQFPITITEVPHRGERRTWTLESAEHLARCIEQAERSGYTDWQIQEGNLAYEEDAEGELVEVKNEAFTLDAYLDWLRHDLSQLIVEDAA